MPINLTRVRAEDSSALFTNQARLYCSVRHTQFISICKSNLAGKMVVLQWGERGGEGVVVGGY